MTESILTPAEVSERFKIPKSTLSYLVVTDQIPYHRVGQRVVRFDLNELQGWWKGRKNVTYHRPTKKK